MKPDADEICEPSSTQDKRNDAGGQYKGEKWQTIFHDSTEPIAKGTWSTTKEDPSFRGGYRRYGAAKLCQVMMVFVSPPPLR